MGGSTGWYMVSAHPLREKECVFDPSALFDWKREARCDIITDSFRLGTSALRRRMALAPSSEFLSRKDRKFQIPAKPRHCTGNSLPLFCRLKELLPKPGLCGFTERMTQRMNDSVEFIPLAPGVRFCTVRASKFKTCRISLRPLCRCGRKRLQRMRCCPFAAPLLRKISRLYNDE